MRRSESFDSLALAETYERLGGRLRAARHARKLTLSMLEERIRVHRTTLGRLERGDTTVSIGVLLRVLEALGVLSDVELLVSQPHTLGHPASSGTAVPNLPTNF